MCNAGVPLVITRELVRLKDGAFNLDFIHPIVSAYEQLGMVLVGGRAEKNAIDAPTLLVNCHYDTVVGSTGTSSDVLCPM